MSDKLINAMNSLSFDEFLEELKNTSLDNINKFEKGDDIFTWAPIHYAESRRHNKNYLLAMMRYKANVNICTKQSLKTPLYFACANNCLDNVKILLENNADPSIKNIHDELPIDTIKSKYIELLVTYNSPPPKDPIKLQIYNKHKQIFIKKILHHFSKTNHHIFFNFYNRDVISIIIDKIDE